MYLILLLNILKYTVQNGSGKALIAPMLLKAGPGAKWEHPVCVCVQSCLFGI